MKAIIGIIALCLLIVGCTNDLSEPLSWNEILEDERIKFGEEIRELWYLSLENDKVQLEVLPMDLRVDIIQKNKTYWVQDGDLQICKHIEGELYQCEPKKIWHTLKVQPAKITFRGTTVDCYLINDSKKTQGNYCNIKVEKIDYGFYYNTCEITCHDGYANGKN